MSKLLNLLLFFVGLIFTSVPVAVRKFRFGQRYERASSVPSVTVSISFKRQRLPAEFNVQRFGLFGISFDK